MKKNDPLNPNHYKSANGRQLIDVIRNMPFSLGNSIKYVYRNKNKINTVEDLKKAVWYLNDYSLNVLLGDAKEYDKETLNIVLEGRTLFEKRIIVNLVYSYYHDSKENMLKTVNDVILKLDQEIDRLS